MKVAVIPDSAMLIVPLVNNHGHECLSSTNLTEEKLRSKDPYDEEPFDKNAPPFTMTSQETLIGNKYASCEVASGVRGRLSLNDNILMNAEAAIILGRAPVKYDKMYNHLNELILFSCNSCNNTYQKTIFSLKNKGIPMLVLAYPTTKEEVINSINQANDFLRNIKDENFYKQHNVPGNNIINNDNLTVDLIPKKEQISIDELKQIIDEI